MVVHTCNLSIFKARSTQVWGQPDLLLSSRPGLNMQDHVSKKKKKSGQQVDSAPAAQVWQPELKPRIPQERTEQTAKSCPLTSTYICPHTQHTHALIVNKIEVSKKQGAGLKELNQFSRTRQVIPESVPQTTAACRRVKGRREAVSATLRRLLWNNSRVTGSCKDLVEKCPTPSPSWLGVLSKT